MPLGKATVTNMDPIGSFMRVYGLKFLYFLFVGLYIYLYTKYFVIDDTHNPTPTVYPLYKTVWIWYLRLIGLITFIPSLAFAATFLFTKLPSVHTPPSKQSQLVKLKNGTHLNGKLNQKCHLECLIVRIITRGDYAGLIRKSVSYHVKLIEQYCKCDKFEIHVVTEKRLDGVYQIGNTAQVREFLVPMAYGTRKGALYKVRNMVYWMENCPNGPRYPPKENTWIISLDDDVHLTESFMIDFLYSFLPSGAHCGTCPSLFELPDSAGFLNTIGESTGMAAQCASAWFECKVMKGTPVWFRGACYAIRRDVEEKVGLDCSSEISITDDHVFGHNFADQGYKMGYINGWIWEGAAFDLISLIQQRGRWLRGFCYALLYQNMSVGRRFSSGIRLAMLFLVIGPVMAGGIVFTLTICLGYPTLLTQAGSRLWPLDYMTPFALTNLLYMTVFGAWHNLSTPKATRVTLSMFCWFGCVVHMGIHLSEIMWTVYTLAESYIRGRQRREIMAKVE